MSDQDRPSIVLTDAAPLRDRSRRAGCPKCGARASSLTLVSPYRPNGPKVCQECGQEIGGDE